MVPQAGNERCKRIRKEVRVLKRAIRLFVSSSPELVAEREVVGQTVAEVPISEGWEIMHTPTLGADIQDVLEFIDTSDFYVMLLGADFTAPMGIEWSEALASGRQMTAYRKRGLYTPAALHLLHQYPDTQWTEFSTSVELKTKMRRSLIQSVLDNGELFGLQVFEIDALLLALKRPVDAPGDLTERQGAGDSAVILSRPRHEEDE